MPWAATRTEGRSSTRRRLVDSLDVSTWPSGSWTTVADPLPSPRQGNEAGFFSTGRVGGEVWSTGGLNGATFQFLNEHVYKAAPLRLRHRLHLRHHLRLRHRHLLRPAASGSLPCPEGARAASRGREAQDPGERTARWAGFDAFVRAAHCVAAW